jgi:hypothetical protein
MRDAKLTFAFAVANPATATTYLISNASVNGVVALTMNATTTGNVTATSVELNYGGLVTNGVTNAVMDANADGSVTADDYVRGQVIRPLYVQVMLNHTGLTAADTILVELHGSNTSGFTPATGTILSQTTYVAAAAAGDDMIILPLQSYAKFLKLKVTSATARTGAVITLTRMHVQNSREGVI